MSRHSFETQSLVAFKSEVIISELSEIRNIRFVCFQWMIPPLLVKLVSMLTSSFAEIFFLNVECRLRGGLKEVFFCLMYV